MSSAVVQLIEPRSHDLGDNFVVRRALPHMRARSVGPFVFFDHMGPVDFAPGRGVDVRPHPHIGLATMTYLFDGAMLHRDSTGAVQEIRAGDVNWMVAGSGIVHSERVPDAVRASGQRLHGVQTWLALPLADEEVAPSFTHYPAAALPEHRAAGVRARVVAGSAFGLEAPSPLATPTLYVALELDAGAELVLDAGHAERALYLLDGRCVLDDAPLEACRLALLAPERGARIVCEEACRAVLFGGAPLDAHRFVWWNFVSSSRERIERAKADWKAQRFGQVPGETEFIPLPE